MKIKSLKSYLFPFFVYLKMTKTLLKILALTAVIILLLIVFKPDLFSSGQSNFEKGRASFAAATESDCIDNYLVEDAISHFETAILKGVTNREVFDELAASYSILNRDNSNSERVYTKGIENYPNDAEFYFRRGNCRRDLGKFESALSDYEKCINLPQNKDTNFIKEAIYQKGAMRYMLGDFENAKKDWKSAQLKTDYELRDYEDYCKLFK